MSIFKHITTAAAVGMISLLLSGSLSMAQQTAQSPAMTAKPAASPKHATAPKTAKSKAATLERKKSAHAAIPQPSSPTKKEHHLILQVNTNDAAAMNLALNNASNVMEYYKDKGEKVKIEVITFGPGLHMLRDDTSPVKARIEEMALKSPEVSFKACGNTREKMRSAENKDIPIIPQAQVVNSGVVRVMELQERGWTYVKP